MRKVERGDELEAFLGANRRGLARSFGHVIKNEKPIFNFPCGRLGFIGTLVTKYEREVERYCLILSLCIHSQ